VVEADIRSFFAERSFSLKYESHLSALGVKSFLCPSKELPHTDVCEINQISFQAAQNLFALP
jgi:hypothetical protein